MEENELSVIENPYYGDVYDIVLDPTRKTQYNVDLNDVEAVTVTENVYYEMWEVWIIIFVMIFI